MKKEREVRKKQSKEFPKPLVISMKMQMPKHQTTIRWKIMKSNEWATTDKKTRHTM